MGLVILIHVRVKQSTQLLVNICVGLIENALEVSQGTPCLGRKFVGVGRRLADTCLQSVDQEQ